MSKLSEIKTACLEARKSGDKTTSSLLITLIGEAEMVGKSAGNRESTDAEVLQVIRKFEKNLNEVIGYMNERGTSGDVMVQYLHELEIIKGLLPAKLTDLQVQKDIGTVMQNLNLVREQKSMGVVVKELKAKYGDQFDGQQVSTQFKLLLGV